MDKSLAVQDTLSQSEILLYSKEHNLGSKKTILYMLKEFIDNRMIKELVLPPDGPGRPRKAYMLPPRKEEETILINLGYLPVPLCDFIQEQSTTLKRGKSEVINQLLTWAYLQYQNGLNIEDQTPKEPLPPHLKSKEIKRDSLRSI
ncbi:MAG: hypothetical protein ACXADY_21605 [Candidatus Hodarchaeales archaeon]|jgi:hypothetical protein